jgi:hypothetical protein
MNSLLLKLSGLLRDTNVSENAGIVKDSVRVQKKFLSGDLSSGDTGYSVSEFSNSGCSKGGVGVTMQGTGRMSHVCVLLFINGAAHNSGLGGTGVTGETDGVGVGTSFRFSGKTIRFSEGKTIALVFVKKSIPKMQEYGRLGNTEAFSKKDLLSTKTGKETSKFDSTELLSAKVNLIRLLVIGFN